MAITRTQIDALLNRLEPPIRQAFERAFENARTRAQLKRLVAAIEASNIEDVLLAAGVRDGMFSALSESVRSAYVEGGMFVMSQSVPKRFAIEFDITNPRAEDWLRTRSATRVVELRAELRGAVQAIMQDGMIRGANPRSTALDIVGRIGASGRRTGGVLGLTEHQTSYVTNLRRILEENPRRYFIKNRITGELKPRFTLADRRFESTIKKAIREKKPIPAATRERIIGRYEDRLMKYRGDTIARTETLRAVNEASDEAMRQVVDEGLAPRNAVTRIWRHSFGANEREGHRMMHGQRRGLDESFNNPITGRVLKHPGDPQGGPGEIINCRCWLEHKIDFYAVERAA